MENGLTPYEYYHKRLFNYVRLNGYSQNTLLVYKSNLDIILNKFPSPEKLDLLEIQEFAIGFKNDNTRKNICVMLRWIYNKVLNRNIQWYELPYPKKKKKIQPVYKQSDLLKVLNVIKNEKQKAILALIVDCGLRASEPCAIKIKDCNSKDRSIILRSAKGDNDRIVYPSEFVWDLIKAYWKSWDEKPKTYLFEGQTKDFPYTTSSIRKFVKMYCNIAGVQYLGLHSIRRFVGTWSIENGASIIAMAEKFGHSSTKTLEKHYVIHSPTYLKNIISPLQKKNLLTNNQKQLIC